MMGVSPRNEKENVRVKSLHVTWSQQYRKYPSKSLQVVPQPLKSILKNRVQRSVFVTSQDIQAELSAINSDPMQNITYFKSPIETLLESTEIDSSDHVSQHDLLEAYNTLQTRIRFQIQVICQSDRDLLAWNVVKSYSSQIWHVLRRDIRRALGGPTSPRKSSSLGGSILSNNLEMTADDIQTAMNLSLVCHQSLRLLSDLFRFPALYSIFSTDDLHILLDDLLTISLTKSLPTHNSRKTHALIIWIIQVQRLPAAVLALKKCEISSALKRAVAGDFDQDKKFDVVSDGLEAVCDLLRCHPSLFFSPLSELLPSTLSCLLSPSFDVRLHAARALNAFVLAKINTTLLLSRHINNSISRHIRSFIDNQSSKCISADSDVRFPTLISAALAVDSPLHSGSGPGWALTVLASFIVLSDSSLFSHSHSLKLFLCALAQAQTHKGNSVRCLLPHVWKCLVWAFLRISTGREGSRRGTTGISLAVPPVDLEDRAFMVVKQELRWGIGLAFVATLLGPTEPINLDTDGHRVTRALSVVKDMVDSDNASTRGEGLSLLTRLVNTIGLFNPVQDAWDCNKVLALSLFDGTIINAKPDHFSAAVRTIHDFKIDEVRHLSEPEIVENWDTLISIWIKCIENHLQGATQLPTNLVQIWHSLLLVQAQLKQDHLTIQIFTKRVATIVSGFFLLASRRLTVNRVEGQVRQLSLTSKLWTIIKNIFEAAWLPVPAEHILRVILGQSFVLSDASVNGEWCKICSDLATAGTPVLLDLLFVRNEFDVELEVKRQLWSILVNTLQSPDVKIAWQDALSFLDVSLGTWTMSDSEFELWKGMLRCAITSAGSANIRPATAIEHMVERFGKEKVTWLSLFPEVTVELLSYISLGDKDATPNHCFALVDSVLNDLYPPQPNLLSAALRLLRLLRGVIVSSPSSLIVTILLGFRRCLCRWIEDRSEVLAEREYNDVIMSLYCDSLSVLRREVPSDEVLQALTSFFTAGFVHIPPPSLGPLAFGAFWRATYHGLKQFYPVYTTSLKDCLKSLDTLEGQGDFCVGLSLDSDFQLTSSSIVPDSQLPDGSDVNISDQSRYMELNNTMDATSCNANVTTIFNVSPILPLLTLQHSTGRVHPASTEISPGHSTALALLCQYSSHFTDSFTEAIPTSDSRRPSDSPQLSSRSFHNLSNASQARRGAQFSASLAPTFSLRSRVSKSQVGLKRATDVFARTTKRRKFYRQPVSPNESAEDGPDLQGQAPFHRLRQSGKKPASEPITGVTSLVLDTEPISEPNAARKKMLFAYVELPTYQQVLDRESRSSQAAVYRFTTSRRVQREPVQIASKTDVMESFHREEGLMEP